MRFALIDSKRVEAKPGLMGLCPVCSEPVIAKCGIQRIHHWAHRTVKTCDNWWEPETEWHRLWKNSFPTDWQETILYDTRTGEKHIADIRTNHDVVIEFQHSHLDPQERTAREDFYQNMVWVVDCTRLKRDYSRFLNGKNHFSSISRGVYRVDYPEKCFPSAWIGSLVPVVFDFRGTEPIDDPKEIRNYLYCLFPVRLGISAIIVVIPRKFFIDSNMNGNWVVSVRNAINNISQVNNKRQL